MGYQTTYQMSMFAGLSGSGSFDLGELNSAFTRDEGLVGAVRDYTVPLVYLIVGVLFLTALLVFMVVSAMNWWAYVPQKLWDMVESCLSVCYGDGVDVEQCCSFFPSTNSKVVPQRDGRIVFKKNPIVFGIFYTCILAIALTAQVLWIGDAQVTAGYETSMESLLDLYEDNFSPARNSTATLTAASTEALDEIMDLTYITTLEPLSVEWMNVTECVSVTELVTDSNLNTTTWNNYTDCETTLAAHLVQEISTNITECANVTSYDAAIAMWTNTTACSTTLEVSTNYTRVDVDYNSSRLTATSKEVHCAPSLMVSIGIMTDNATQLHTIASEAETATVDYYDHTEYWLGQPRATWNWAWYGSFVGMVVLFLTMDFLRSRRGIDCITFATTAMLYVSIFASAISLRAMIDFGKFCMDPYESFRNVLIDEGGYTGRVLESFLVLKNDKICQGHDPILDLVESAKSNANILRTDLVNMGGSWMGPHVNCSTLDVNELIDMTDNYLIDLERSYQSLKCPEVSEGMLEVLNNGVCGIMNGLGTLWIAQFFCLVFAAVLVWSAAFASTYYKPLKIEVLEPLSGSDSDEDDDEFTTGKGKRSKEIEVREATFVL